MNVRNGVVHLTRREMLLIAAPARRVPIGQLACLTATIHDLQKRQSTYEKIGGRYARISNDPNLERPFGDLKPAVVEKRLAKALAMAAQIAPHGVQYAVPAAPEQTTSPDVNTGLAHLRTATIARDVLAEATNRAFTEMTGGLGAMVDEVDRVRPTVDVMLAAAEYPTAPNEQIAYLNGMLGTPPAEKAA